MSLLDDMSNRGLAFAGGVGFFEAAGRCLDYVRDPSGYRATIDAELAQTTYDHRAEDGLFGRHAFVMQWLELNPSFCLRLWDICLAEIRFVDEVRYRQMHKGAPFYFMAMAAYMAGELDRFSTILDAAVAEDERAVNTGCWNNPAGKWLRFDTTTAQQAAYFQNVDAQQLLDRVLADASPFAAGGTTRQALVGKLTIPLFQARPELRGVVAALLGFLLQYRSMMREVRLMEVSVGAGARVYGFLFRGCAAFESFVRLSADGAAVTAGNPGATLNSLVTAPAIYPKLGFAVQPTGLGVTTFDALVVRSREPLDAGESEQMRSIRITWALRNATGHNLGAPSVVRAADAERLGLRVAAAICTAVATLY